MSESHNCRIDDLAKYDAMTTEQLEEILRLDAEMPEGQESDGELLLYIMEVLAQRKRERKTPGKTAREAYESFKQNYMPETDNNVIPMKTNHRCPRWARGLTAAAAVLAILVVGSVTAEAFGFPVWKCVIQWTQDTFHFGNWGNSDTNNNLAYASIQEALEKGNTPAWLVPTKFPEGFNLTEVSVQQTPLKKTYTAIYKNGDKPLKIMVRDYLKDVPVYVEQSEGLVEKIEISGITYYLFENNEQAQVSWIVDSYECGISGKITIDELKLMINAIEKG